MKYFLITLLIVSSTISNAQPNAYERSASSSEMYARLAKLQSPLRILYVAAHPDDENSRLIASLSRDYKAHVTYLSLTRGSGGQNRIGTEQGQLLGVLRTQELLSARRIDGARQEFTSAYDFGYSKTPEETLSQWDSTQLVREITEHIRALQPHLVITRFPTTGEGGHGHHTASAILAEVAFQLAGDSDYKTNLPPWQPVRLLWNTWIPERVDPADTSGLISLNIDEYDPLDGASTSHIAAHSRSQNRCQSFGTSYETGNYATWFKVLAGKPAVYSIFDNCPTSWSTLSGALAGFDTTLQSLLKDFDFHNPSATAVRLGDLRQELMLSSYSDQLLDSIQHTLLPNLFVALSGIELSARSPSSTYHKDTFDTIRVYMNNRLGLPLEFPTSLTVHEHQKFEYLPKNTMEILTAYHEFDKGSLTVKLPITYQTKTAAVTWEIEVPIRHYSTHDVYGEQSQQVNLVPDITARVDEILYWTSLRPQNTSITLLNAGNSEKSVEIATTDGWDVTPKILKIGANDTSTFEVSISPVKTEQLGTLFLKEQGSSERIQQLQTVAYDHIEHQTVQVPTTIKLSQTGARITNKLVAYIHGVGDKVPDVLTQLGVDVTVLEPSFVSADVLSNYEVVVLGIRSYNAIPSIAQLHTELLEYCDNGGTVVVQYVTTRNKLYQHVGPYELDVSWNRITEETAPLVVHLQTHEVFTYPNAISNKDYEHWVQERGLYFGKPARRGDYLDLVYGNDSGEEQVGGALLITDYGMGTWVYTGLSFFRQLPAGVPGAIQLYMNILSL